MKMKNTKKRLREWRTEKLNWLLKSSFFLLKQRRAVYVSCSPLWCRYSDAWDGNGAEIDRFVLIYVNMKVQSPTERLSGSER